MSQNTQIQLGYVFFFEWSIVTQQKVPTGEHGEKKWQKVQ